MPAETRILLIGTLPPPLGGASVLVKQLVEGLEAHAGAELVLVNTSGIRGSGWLAPFRLLKAAVQLFMGAFRSDVLTMHISGTRGTSIAFLLVGSLVVLAKGISRRPLVIRTFANTYVSDEQPGWARRWTRSILGSADLFLVETKASVERAKGDGFGWTQWFPNVRPLPTLALPNRRESPCRRFLYLGHVRPEKGLHLLQEAALSLPQDVTVDAYGALLGGMEEAHFETGRVRYCGELQPSEVIPKIVEYDALVLPTLYDSEGYPGVVLEAYMAGVPVIASRVGGIPEIVSETSGVLIDKGDVSQLESAMKRWVDDPEEYHRFCAGALEQRAFFPAERWTECFVTWCTDLAQGREPQAPNGPDSA